MNGKLITAPDGLKGFDADVIVTPELASLFYQHGYRFVVRYVRRASPHLHDLSASEAQGILTAGLGLMIVQHVAPEGWTPSPALGQQYGDTAATEAAAIGYRAGAIVWCDLEGVALGVPSQEVIRFCNEWHARVKAAGYEPGLYVGYGAGLSATQLYKNLRFSRYWSAYNLNADSFPAVRGVQMKQGPYPGSAAVPGIHFEFDVDTTHADALGSRVLLLTDIEWTP